MQGLRIRVKFRMESLGCYDSGVGLRLQGFRVQVQGEVESSVFSLRVICRM